jgi:hypothetical protein
MSGVSRLLVFSHHQHQLIECLVLKRFKKRNAFLQKKIYFTNSSHYPTIFVTLYKVLKSIKEGVDFGYLLVSGNSQKETFLIFEG